MRLTPPLTWAHLFPSDVAYAGTNLPEDFLPLLATGGDPARRVWIAWREPTRDLPRLADLSGLVAVNCRGVSTRKLMAAGFSYVRRFAVLPSLRAPRWFIPLDRPAVAAGAFCLYSPLRASARLTYIGVRAAARSGLPIWYRDQITIAQRNPPPVERELRSIFPGTPVRLALSCGPVTGPDTQRKAAIAVLDPAGHAVAFGKLAGSWVAARVLRHEAEVLPALSDRLGLGWGGPRLLLAGEVDGTYMTFQTAVRGRRSGSELTPAHRRLLETLQCGEPRAAAETHFVRALWPRLTGVPELLPVLDGVLPALESLTLPGTITHGDFLPWNLREQHGRVVAFDWEHSDLDGLPLVDELDHLLGVGDLVHHWTMDQARDRVEQLVAASPLGLAPDRVRALAAVYLLNLIARLVEMGHSLSHPRVAWNYDLLLRVTPRVDKQVVA